MVHNADIKCQVADALTCFSWPGKDEYRFKNDVPVEWIAEAQAEGEQIGTDAKHLHSPQSNHGMDVLKLAMPEILEVLDETDRI